MGKDQESLRRLMRRGETRGEVKVSTLSQTKRGEKWGVSRLPSRTGEITTALHPGDSKKESGGCWKGRGKKRWRIEEREPPAAVKRRTRKNAPSWGGGLLGKGSQVFPKKRARWLRPANGVQEDLAKGTNK